MKLLLAITLLAAVALACAETTKISDEEIERAHKLAGECLEKGGFAAESVELLRKGDFDKADDKVKCFASCYLEKAGLVFDGVINLQAVKKNLGSVFGDEFIDKVIAKCHDIKGTDPCDTAFELYKCYYAEKAAYI